jgi:uncharacterized protein
MNYPITNASLNLTQQCNLACSYCFNGKKSNERMSFETAVKCVDFILKETAEANINRLNGKQRKCEIQFWGGEPLLEWEMIKDITLYAENTKYKDVIVIFNGTTNGVLLTEEKFDFMSEHQISFMVSLDGSPNTHNYYRKFYDGRDSQEIVIGNILKAMGRWPMQNIRMSLFPERIEYFAGDISYLVGKGITNIMWSPVYEANWNDYHWKVLEEQLFLIADFMVEAGRKHGISTSFKEFQRDDRFDKFEKYPCGAGRHYVGFDVDGAIYICHRFAKFEDRRPWQEKENCIGHVDVGITRPEVRAELIGNPTKGGCPAVNFDCAGDMGCVPVSVARYEAIMKKAREYNGKSISGASPQQIMNVVRGHEERIMELEKSSHVFNK